MALLLMIRSRNQPRGRSPAVLPQAAMAGCTGIGAVGAPPCRM